MRKRVEVPMGFYGITAENFANGKSNFECVKQMINAGVKLIQYRDKEKTIKQKFTEAKEIVKFCHDNGVKFIVNDYIDIALLVGADGVHVGQDDLPVSEVRKLIGDDKILGLSTHSIAQGEEANKDENVDYIGVGPIFPTTTKDTAPIGLEYLKYASQNFTVPFFAIGGIKIDKNLHHVTQNGANGVCIVSEVVGAGSIKEKVEKINQKLKI